MAKGGESQLEVINALSFDVEDWYHPELVREVVKEPHSQIMESTRPIIDLLDRYRIKASFFIVGEIAEQNPDLVETIFLKGHEIGCHGYSHKPLWALNESLFRGELELFHSAMERILGKVNIKGFRAPTFSLDDRTQWALRVLRDFGYQYDASLFPAKINPLYGVRGVPARPYHISLEDLRKEDSMSPLIEFPLPLLTLGKLKIPISGGFYLRVFPLPFLSWGLRRINRHQPFMLYFHPWEGYTKTPRQKLPLYNRLISYYGTRFSLRKVESLLQRFKFGRVDEVLGLMR
jgi:polysaccharide deacetylase family protein (PEP-CTERM system associated)